MSNVLDENQMKESDSYICRAIRQRANFKNSCFSGFSGFLEAK